MFGAIKAFIALILAIFARKSGKEAAENDALKDLNRKQEKGREALRAGRDSGLSPDERVRRNDGRW